MSWVSSGRAILANREKQYAQWEKEYREIYVSIMDAVFSELRDIKVRAIYARLEPYGA